MRKCEVAIVGLGAMGSSIAYHLSKKDINVVAFDQFRPPHSLGSSHGDTRITRLATGEGREYTALATRSQEIFRNLEDDSGRNLFMQCGGLVLGKEDNAFLTETITSAEEAGIEHIILNSTELKRRYPMFNVTEDTIACLEPSAGFVVPEATIAANLEGAARMGARIFFNTEVLSIDTENTRLVASGTEWQADNLIIAAGAWNKKLVPQLEESVKIYQQILYWFSIAHGYDQLKSIPVFIWELGADSSDFIYGFPAINGKRGGLKVATESFEKEVDPSSEKSMASEEEKTLMYNKYIKNNLPWLENRVQRALSCFYSNTDDGRFIIDKISDSSWVVSACSGHGFKHSLAIGEALSEQIIDGKSKIDLSFFQKN